MTERFRWLAPLLFCATVSVPALGDAVPPAPERCPRGSTPETSHAGPHCEPATCRDGKCPAGQSCKAVKLCVEAVNGTSRGGSFVVSNVKGPCGPGDSCVAGTCQSLSVCERPTPLSRCGCSLEPSPALPSFAALSLLALATLSRRRRRLTGSCRS